ncbi:MAG TPA: hypothetical protein VEL51_15095 [Vicinamibacterales bacterium]|nr:hypothetical protein [Vicinamibacterales bacterium]
MRWIVYVLAAIAIVGVLVVIIGYSLPKAHSASRITKVGLPPDATYTLLTEMAQASEVPVRLERLERPTLFVARICDPSLPFGGTWTYRIAPAGTGSEVTITEDGEVYNPFFRFMSRFVFGHYATLDGFMKKLEARAK